MTLKVHFCPILFFSLHKCVVLTLNTVKGNEETRRGSPICWSSKPRAIVILLQDYKSLLIVIVIVVVVVVIIIINIPFLDFVLDA